MKTATELLAMSREQRKPYLLAAVEAAVQDAEYAKELQDAAGECAGFREDLDACQPCIELRRQGKCQLSELVQAAEAAADLRRVISTRPTVTEQDLYDALTILRAAVRKVKGKE